MCYTIFTMDKRIEELSDERASGNDWLVYLVPGWQYDGAHCFGEATLKDVRKTMKFVKPCVCADCKKR